MTRPLLLDLFCCEGGAAMGYHRAGFDVIGVDIEPRPKYPFPFVQADALNPPFDLSSFDAIHASPPCQAFSAMTPAGNSHPDLIEPVRAMLQASGLPYVIENVPGAPIDATLVLCGTMFGKDYQRHRLFESNVLMLNGMACDHSRDCWGVYGLGGEFTGERPGGGSRGKKAGTERARDLFGMPWASRNGVSQCIPPAYTEFIGQQMLVAL